MSINRFISRIALSKKSSFYHDLWGTADTSTLDALPTLTWEQLRATPYKERLYTTEGLLTKITYRNERACLIARSLADIKKEAYGALSYERPLVLFERVHESIEKGAWLHQHNILPLIREPDLIHAVLTSTHYGIDSIIGSSTLLTEFAPLLQKEYSLEHIRYITVIDEDFSVLESLKSLYPHTQVEAVFALPETGALGYQCPHTKELRFHPNNTTIIESTPELTCTRTILLPTPIIRYQPGITIHIFQNHTCACESPITFTPIS